jgi:hypothetical protein
MSIKKMRSRQEMILLIAHKRGLDRMIVMIMTRKKIWIHMGAVNCNKTPRPRTRQALTTPKRT